MRPAAYNPFRPFRTRRTRAFTFIELIVAVALSMLLIRGMYTVFAAATGVTRLSEEKTAQLLEVSALYEALSTDFARIPYSGTRSFSVTDTSIVFRASPRSGAADVLIKYEYDGAAKRVKRSVTALDGATAVDDDGDGVGDTNAVIARNIVSFDVKFHNGGDINGTWSTGVPTVTKAIRFIFRQATVTAGGELPEETFVLILPVMFL